MGNFSNKTNLTWAAKDHHLLTTPPNLTLLPRSPTLLLDVKSGLPSDVETKSTSVPRREPPSPPITCPLSSPTSPVTTTCSPMSSRLTPRSTPSTRMSRPSSELTSVTASRPADSLPEMKSPGLSSRTSWTPSSLPDTEATPPMPSTPPTWTSPSFPRERLTPPASTFSPPDAEPEDPSLASDSPPSTPSRREEILRDSSLKDLWPSRVTSPETTPPLLAPDPTHLRWEVCPRLTPLSSELEVTSSRSPTPPSSSPLDVVATGPTPVVSSTTRTRTSSSGLTRRITPESSPWRGVITFTPSSRDSVTPPRPSPKSSPRTAPAS